MNSLLTPEQLHYRLIRHVVETGRAPELEESPELRELEAMHGVILVPNSTRVWSIHPFAMSPTSFWVTTGRGVGWWANCAWCSLAIGAALNQDITIFCQDGGEDQRLAFRVENGRATQPEMRMHFPYPPARWWDNPFAPCSNILFFSSEARIAQWCARHGHPKGAVLNMEQAIELARRWFGDYAQEQWRRKTPAQAAAIFAEMGLDPEFWQMPETFR